MRFISNYVISTSFTLKYSIISNVQIAPSRTMFNLGSMLSFSIDNCTIQNVNSLDPEDTGSVIFGYSTIVLENPLNSIISNVEYSNSSVRLIEISALIPPASMTKYFTFENIYFHDWYFTSRGTMITTHGLSYDLDIQFSFDNITFENIEFQRDGKIFYFSHQFQGNLSLSNLVLKNIKRGYIFMQATDRLSTSLFTNINIINANFDTLEQGLVSSIEVEEGSRLFISNSSFTNIFSLTEGSVLTGGYRDTVTVITNSSFTNNSAVSGGVLNVQDGSVVKWYSCTIKENFAITSGVINVIQNGFFEFYDSLIFSNYAYHSPVSQLFDSQTESIISHSEIHSNQYLPESEIVEEMNTQCTNLCFWMKYFQNMSLIVGSLLDLEANLSSS